MALTSSSSGVYVNKSFEKEPDDHLREASVVCGSANEKGPPPGDISVTVQFDIVPQSTPSSELAEEDLQPNNNAATASWKNYIGIFFALLSTVFFSLLILTIKLIPEIHPVTQSIWRYGVYTLVNILVVAGFSACERRGKNDKESEATSTGAGGGVFHNVFSNTELSVKECWLTFGKLVAAAAIGCTGTLFESTALNYMNVADATVVTYISLVYVLILAHLFIGEKCSVLSTLMACCIILGIGIISRPPFLTGATEFNMTLTIGLCIKLFDAFCTAIYVIAVRMFRHLHFAYLSLVIGAVGLILAIISSFSLQLFAMPSTGNEVGLLLGLGILHCLSNVCVILALRFEKAGPVTLLRTFNVPLVFLWQIVILDIFPDMWTILGSILVCFGVIVTSVRKWVEELPKDSTTKKNLWWLLV